MLGKGRSLGINAGQAPSCFSWVDFAVLEAGRSKAGNMGCRDGATGSISGEALTDRLTTRLGYLLYLSWATVVFSSDGFCCLASPRDAGILFLMASRKC